MELTVFSGEETDWGTWHNVYSSKARIHGFSEELVATDEIRVGAEDFNNQSIDSLFASFADAQEA